MKDMNKVKGPIQKVKTITNAREKNKIVTQSLGQRNINAKNTSKFHTLDLNKNSMKGHFKTKDIQFSTNKNKEGKFSISPTLQQQKEH